MQQSNSVNYGAHEQGVYWLQVQWGGSTSKDIKGADQHVEHTDSELSLSTRTEYWLCFALLTER